MGERPREEGRPREPIFGRRKAPETRARNRRAAPQPPPLSAFAPSTALLARRGRAGRIRDRRRTPLRRRGPPAAPGGKSPPRSPRLRFDASQPNPDRTP